MNRSKDILIGILLVSATFFLLIFNIGGFPLFDWDEINFAEISREMIVSGNYLQPQIGFNPFYEKPPLFNWMQVICMKYFGISEFAARLPNTLCGVFSVLMIYIFGLKNDKKNFSFYWILSFIGCFLSFIFFKSGIIDPWFNLFIYGGIILFIDGYFKNLTNNKYLWHILLSGIFIGLAVLTKGPVAIILSATPIFIFFLLNRKEVRISYKIIAIWVFPIIIVSSSWFIYETNTHGYTYLKEFLTYQLRLFRIEDAEHGGFPGYHFIVILIGCFPASIFCLRQFNFKLKPSYTSEDLYISINSILIILVLVLFSIVQTKIIHYSSLAYFPIAYLSAQYYYKINSLDKTQKILLITIGILYTLFLIALGYIPELKKIISIYLNDITIIEQFSQNIPISPLEKWGTIILAFSLISSVLLFIYSPSMKLIIAITTFVILNVELFYFVHLPKLERYTQGGIVDFCKEKSKEDAYFHTFRMKSYAIYYYTNYRFNDSLASNRTWLIENNNLEKDCYFVVPLKAKREIDSVFKLLIPVYNERGIVVYKKIKNPINK